MLKYLIYFLFILNSTNAKDSQCYTPGKTWSNLGDLEIIGNIDNAEKCLQLCLKNSDCKGYTWYGNSTFVADAKLYHYCILFSTLEDEYECQNCISGETSEPEKCICPQKDGECENQGNNYLSGGFADSLIECQFQCIGNENCSHYTWFGPGNENSHNLCILFSSCENITPCGSECTTGKIKSDPEPYNVWFRELATLLTSYEVGFT